MVTMENSEEILQILERFTRLKQKEIPKELEEYLQYVAKTGDTVFKWSSLKYLFREKLLHVIKHFNEDSPRLEEIPNYPNVDPFNYETMKSSLLERLDLFNAAPFTVQRLCELLIDPRKQYSRIDKFMRALEKNILVVSTIEPGRKRTESENGDSLDSVVNGDLSLEVNIDIEMENESLFNSVDERNGNVEDSGSGALKVSCPRSDDGGQPKAKKVKLDYDEEDRIEATTSTDDMDDEAPLETGLKGKPDVESIDAEVDATDGTGVNQEKKTLADAQQQTAEIADAAVEPSKQSLNGQKHKDKETEKSENDAAAAAASDGDDEDEEEQQQQASAKATAGPAAKETAKETNAKVADVETDEAEAEQPEKVVEQPEIESIEKSPKPADQTKPAGEPKPLPEESKQPAGNESAADSVVEQAKKPETAVTTAKAAEPLVASESSSSEAAAASKTTAAADEASDSAAVAETKAQPEASESSVDKTETEPTTKPQEPEAKEAAVAAPPAAKEGEQKTDKTVAAVTVAKGEPIETDEPIAAAPVAAPELVTSASPAVLPAAPAAPPALALNDQPMEDTPADEDLAVSPSAAVDEVVMAETASAGGDMATDDNAKDEPAAMEVDDTSQEVMDQ